MDDEERETPRAIMRRVGLVTFLAFLAGMVFYLRTDAVFHGVPVSIITGLTYAAVVGPVTIVLCVYWPAVSTLIECAAISRLLVSILVFACPAIGDRLLTNPALMACLIVLGALVLRRAGRDYPHPALAPA